MWKKPQTVLWSHARFRASDAPYFPIVIFFRLLTACENCGVMTACAKTALGAFTAVTVPVLIGSVLWLEDIRDDRRHTVIVNASTPVFSGNPESGDCRGKQLTTVEKGLKLRVLRIRYFKDCAAVNIVLPDGRKGYIVLGVGDVSVLPPLPMT